MWNCEDRGTFQQIHLTKANLFYTLPFTLWMHSDYIVYYIIGTDYILLSVYRCYEKMFFFIFFYHFVKSIYYSQTHFHMK